MSTSSEPLNGTEIAVIGMSARLPGADTLEAFWRNLREGVESVRRFTPEELREAGESAALLADPDYVPARPVIANVDQFDAGFFGLSPQDAAIMDPQHRLFLEVGWEALEHAGHDPSRFAGNIGVFATCGMNTYMMYHLVTNRRIMETVGEWLVRHTGNDMNFLATRLSYQLGLKGPSMNVQTACSSALVAIHVASQSLLNGECDMALAGGVVIALPQDRGYLYKKGEILSPDGHCRAFDARAAGTLFGSGAGVVALRRLADALEDGDRVLAVVRGSAVNNDGAMKVGYLAPGVEGQSRAVTEALAVAGVDPETITYVEAHGTGTLVGDPIEITALTDAYRRHTDKRGYCAIGSLKSNIGHLGEAAGVAGFIKTVLSLQHREIPPSLHFETPNPRIDFANSPFFVNGALRPWRPANGAPRRAGITALGAGGTNCHVVLEEAPAAAASPPAPPARAAELLVLSAKTATALEAAAARLARHLESQTAATAAPASSATAVPAAVEESLADVAYTLQVGRQTFAHRRAIVARTREEAIALLRGGAPDATSATTPTDASAGADAASNAASSAGAMARGLAGATLVSASGDPKAHPVAFLFPGGGAQYAGMGAGLYRTEAVFRDAVDRCLGILRTRHGIDLRPLLFPPAEAREQAARLLEQSTHSILSIFTIEYALAQLWISWGVKPSAMTGHSVGEYAAACIAGVFSLEDALAIVLARGRIFERLPAGAMVSVALPEADVRPRLRGALGIAAVNAPALCVVSGPAAEVDTFERELSSRGIEARRLHIAVAAHSAMLEPFLEDFRRQVASVRLSPPAIPFISNLSGRWIRAEEATDPSYWVAHLRQTVRFSDGLAALAERPDLVWLEVGPGRTLSSLARQQGSAAPPIVTSMRHRDEEIADDLFVLGAAARLWAYGAGPDWRAFHAGTKRRRVALPTYPFERKRYWIPAGDPLAGESAAELEAAAGEAIPAPTPVRERDLADWFARPVWRATPIADAAMARRDARAPRDGQVGATEAGDLLIFDDASRLGEEIAAAAGFARDDAETGVDASIAAGAGGEAAGAETSSSDPRGARVWIVEAGEAFERRGPARFAVRPGVAEDYAALFDALGDSASRVRRVLHVWNVETDAARPADGAADGRDGADAATAAAALDARLARSFFAPVRLAQTIGRLELTQPIAMTLVSTGVQRVAGETAIDPVKATLQGPARVISRELPNVSCRHVDVEPPASAWQRRRLVQQLARDLRAPVIETSIAYRGADRWVQHYERLRLAAAAAVPAAAPNTMANASAPVAPVASPDHAPNAAPAAAASGATNVARAADATAVSAAFEGAALITGGLGGVGLEVAERLARAGHRRIALVGRTPLPPRETWEARIAAAEAGGAATQGTGADPIAHRLRKLRACEALGAELLVLAGDVTDASAVRQIVGETRARFGHIGAVFHAAGLLDDGLMQMKSDESAMSVLRPKVHGTLAIEAALGDDPPELLVLFSSISAVLGLQGQVDYAAANAFLDAFAHGRASGATRVVSANWCAWRDVGLAVSIAQARQQTPRASSSKPGPHPWLERQRKGAQGETRFSTMFARDKQWVIGEHVTRDGDALMPGTGYLELARAAVEPIAQGRPIELAQIYFESPFVLPAADARELDVTLRAASGHSTGTDAAASGGPASPDGGSPTFEWTIHSANTTHASGKAIVWPVRHVPATLDIAAIRARCPRHRAFTGGVLDQSFMAFGPRWSNITDAWYGNDEALLALALPAPFVQETETFRLHPALLDLATGGAQAIIPGFAPARDFYVPFSYGRVVVHTALPARCVSHVRLASGTTDGLALFDVTIADEQGRVAAEIAGFCMKRVTAQQLVQAESEAAAVPAEEPRAIETSAELAEEMLRLGLRPAEGIEALERILAGPAMPQVLVSTVDVATWQAQLAEQTRKAAARAAEAASARAVKQGRVQTGAASGGGATAGGGDEIEDRLAAIWSEILGVEHIAPRDDFFELGGHSLLAVRLLTRIERIFGRAVTMPQLFNAPTIAGLAAVLRAAASDTRPKAPALVRVSRDAFRVPRKNVTP